MLKLSSTHTTRSHSETDCTTLHKMNINTSKYFYLICGNVGYEILFNHIFLIFISKSNKILYRKVWTDTLSLYGNKFDNIITPGHVCWWSWCLRSGSCCCGACLSDIALPLYTYVSGRHMCDIYFPLSST